MPDPSSQSTPPPSPFSQGGDPQPAVLPTDPQVVPAKSSWFEALFLCVISSQFYVEVIRRWRGLGFVFMGCVMLLVSIPCAMKLHDVMAKQLRAVNDIVTPQMPRIEIKGGKATTNVPQPHIIYENPKDPKSTPVALIDTSIAKIDFAKRTEYVIVTGEMIYMRVGAEPGQFVPMQMGEDEVLDANLVRGFCTFMTHISGWIFYPILVLRNFLVWSLHALLLAGLSSLMMMGRRIGANFGDLLRMSMIACTPAIYLDTVAFLAEIRWDLWSMILAVVAVMYVTSALRAAAEAAENDE